MKTDRLIETLALDGGRPAVAMGRTWSVTVIVATAVAAAVFFATLGLRPDIADAVQTVRFLAKFVVTLALFVSALMGLVALARPEISVRSILPPLLAAPALLLLAVGLELLAIPASEIGLRLIGTNSLVCLTFIPLIGIGPLVALLFALRQAATTHPSFAGAVAGLVSGGIAATFYAAQCIDDSPLFVATWYPIAIAMLAVLGAVAGRFVARW